MFTSKVGSLFLASCMLFPVVSRAEEPSKLIVNLDAGKKQVVVLTEQV